VWDAGRDKVLPESSAWKAKVSNPDRMEKDNGESTAAGKQVTAGHKAMMVIKF
jgi:hypothetical protein